MPAWLKPYLAPIGVLLLISGGVALHHFGLISFKGVTLPDSPEMRKFSADLPTIALAFLFGMLGAFIRASGAAAVGSSLRALVIGGVVGVIVFVILKSEVVPQIMYSNFASKDLEVDFYRMALLAVVGGLYSGELTRWASGGR